MNHNNKKIKYLGAIHKLIQIFIFTLFSQFSVAGTDMTVNYSGALNYSGPADAVGVGQLIGSTWVAMGNQQMCHSSAMDIARAVIVPISAPTQLKVNIDGVVYSTFATGIPGISWIMSIKDSHAYYYSALGATENQWYPALGTGDISQIDIGGDVKVSFIKTDTRLITGTSVIPAQNFAKIVCYRQDGSIVDQAFIKTSNRVVTVQAKGCSVTTPANATLNLGDFTNYHFPSVGSTVGNASYTISLSCDADVNLKATVSDQTNKTNTSNIVTLTPSSAAHGLGVQVFYNGSTTPLALGPDNSSIGNLNQFSIARTSSNNQTMNVPLQFKYIRTGAITAGSANAIVGLTFSYQ